MPVNTTFRGIDYFESTFRNQINANGEIENREFVFKNSFGEGVDQNPVEAGRYRIIWMPGCPHAHKVVLVWKLLGLDKVISLGTTGILRSPTGWVFSEDPGEKDPVLQAGSVHELYLKTDPAFTGRSTVPFITDVHTGLVANNDHYYIPIYLETAWKKYHREGAPDLYPKDLREDIDQFNRYIYERVNQGFYESGFARSQDKHELGYEHIFEALDFLEEHLSKRRFLFGDFITDTDLRLFPSLVRYRQAYHQIFRDNKKRLDDYPNLWDYARDIYQIPDVKKYTSLNLIKLHYQTSPHLRALFGNQYGLFAKGPDNEDWDLPTNRAELSAHENKFRYEDPEWIPSNKTITEDDRVTEIREELEKPIKNAGEAVSQPFYEAYFDLVFHKLQLLNEELETKRYLMGEKITQADRELYDILIRFDIIYYFAYRLNLHKIEDYANLRRYVRDLYAIKEFSEKTDFDKIKEEFYENQNEIQNPYHIIQRGPDMGWITDNKAEE